MIIAWFLFIVFLICSVVMIVIILSYIFTDKINKYKENVVEMTIPSLVCLFGAVCSAQYIWG